MATTIPIPKLGQSEETVTIQSWKVKEGDTIKKGDVLFDVETDKAVLEVESQFEGTILKIFVPAGKEVPVMSVAAAVGDPGEPVPVVEPPKMPEKKPEPSKPAAPSPAPGLPKSPSPSAETPASNAVPAAPAQTVKPNPSPRARAFAKDYLINLDKVPGTGGSSGRVTEADVKLYLETTGYHSKRITPTALKLARDAKLELLSLSGSGESGRITISDVKDAISEKPRPLSTMRKVIAKRLTESKQRIPHFYVTISIDMGVIAEKRKSLKKDGISIGVNSFIAKAVALALKEFPCLNAECDGSTVRFKSKVNVGIAVSLENGLVVPVVKDADKKSLDEIQDEIAELAELARAGRLAPEQMSGGTFTISNMGMLNVECFAAIINPGETGILAVSSTVPTPVAMRDGSIVVKNMMKVTLSADHRAVDGADGAKFVNALKSKLEDASLWDSMI